VTKEAFGDETWHGMRRRIADLEGLQDTLTQQLAAYHRMAQAGVWISNEEYWSLCRQGDAAAKHGS
jgi:hypothetical protein